MPAVCEFQNRLRWHEDLTQSVLHSDFPAARKWMALILYLRIQIHFLNGFFSDLNAGAPPLTTPTHSPCRYTQFHVLPGLFCSHWDYFQLNSQNFNYWHSPNLEIPIHFRSLLGIDLFLSILRISFFSPFNRYLLRTDSVTKAKKALGYLFIDSVFSECQPCARNNSRHFDEWNKNGPWSYRAYSLVGEGRH